MDQEYFSTGFLFQNETENLAGEVFESVLVHIADIMTIVVGDDHFTTFVNGPKVVLQVREGASNVGSDGTVASGQVVDDRADLAVFSDTDGSVIIVILGHFITFF